MCISAGKFAGEIHISKAIPTKATVTEPPVKEKHILPEGLKMRNMPFGAGVLINYDMCDDEKTKIEIM